MKIIKFVAMSMALLAASTTVMAESNYVYRQSLGHYDAHQLEKQNNANHSGADIQNGQPNL